MGEFVIKAAPDIDLYGLYSTISGSVEHTGDRRDTEAFLSTPTADRGVPPLASVQGPAACLARADATGTSAAHAPGRGPLPGSWDGDGLTIATDGGFRFLRRERFAAYLRSLHTGDDDADALLEPRHQPEADPRHGDR